jgi:hypothetical protein
MMDRLVEPTKALEEFDGPAISLFQGAEKPVSRTARRRRVSETPGFLKQNRSWSARKGSASPIVLVVGEAFTDGK